MQTRTHTYTHTQMPEHTQTHSETEPAKYQCTSAGHRRAAESTRERTHSHQTRCKRTHTRSHTLSHSHSCTLVQRFFGGHCLKARGDERAENENRGEGRGKERKGEKIEEMEKSSTELFSLFRKICHPCAPWFPSKGHSTFDHLMSGGRTLSMFSFFRRGHLSDLDPYGAAQEWIYCKRRQNIKFFFFQCFVGTEVASEFGVCWVAVVFAEMEMAADAEESCLGKRQKAS